MDLNTALMESITSMSEFFVATNTRTSFTEHAESASLGSLTSSANSSQLHIQNPHNNNNGGGANSTATTNNTSLNNLTQQSNLNQQFSSSPGLHKTLANTSQNHRQHTIQQQSHLNQHHHHNSNHSNSLSVSLNSSCDQGYHNHSSLSNLNTGTSSMQSTRLSQPMRTQIPIHCYIEQLDACADMPGCASPLNDNDLFNTTNSSINTTNISHNNKSSSIQTNHHQPHLHQSKLALESVTNCNGSSSLSMIASSGSLFNENDTNNNNDNNDLDDVDTLGHLGSTSPLSIHQAIPSSASSNIQKSSICNNNSNNFRQAISSYDTHHFQSCKETYAIVTSNVLYIDLVRTVLLQLGYSAMDLINAKATIQIKNWRPLALDQVTEDKTATVGEVLGDISTFVTLRIRLYSSVTQLPAEWTETMIRQVVLALTQTMSQLTLSKLCNISQPLISSIVRGGKKLGRRKCAEFGQWYMNYIKSNEARPSTMFCEGGGARLVFDKTREIPQLKAWFQNNTKPSDDLLEEYSKILNEHALRKDRPQVTAKALKNWWKNERQKLGIRQREIRGRPKLKRID